MPHRSPLAPSIASTASARGAGEATPHAVVDPAWDALTREYARRVHQWLVTARYIPLSDPPTSLDTLTLPSHTAWERSIERLMQEIPALALELDHASVGVRFTLRTLRYYRARRIVPEPTGQGPAARYGLIHLLSALTTRFAGETGRWTMEEARQEVPRHSLTTLVRLLVEMAATLTMAARQPAGRFPNSAAARDEIPDRNGSGSGPVSPGGTSNDTRGDTRGDIRGDSRGHSLRGSGNSSPMAASVGYGAIPMGEPGYHELPGVVSSQATPPGRWSHTGIPHTGMPPVATLYVDPRAGRRRGWDPGATTGAWGPTTTPRACPSSVTSPAVAEALEDATGSGSAPATVESPSFTGDATGDVTTVAQLGIAPGVALLLPLDHPALFDASRRATLVAAVRRAVAPR